MGACSKTTSLPGKFTEAQVRKAFDQLWDEAREYSGSDPYNGDWNTISELRVKPHVKFLTLRDADEALADSVEKGCAVAVRVKEIDESKSKRLVTNAQNIRELCDQLWYKRAEMTPRQQASLQKKIDTLHAKRREMITAMAEKSKKEMWYIFGWAYE